MFSMKFGIIGSGMIAGLHAKAIEAMEGGTLHSVYNHRAEGAVRLAAAHGVAAHSDLTEFLADPELEIVTICTPSGAHFEPALAALEAGKHAICEKPLEVTTARIDHMMSVASARGRTLASVLNRRFNPAMEAMKMAVEEDRFGRLCSASCYVKWFRDQAYYDSADWRGTVALDGGGVLMNQAIHAIDSLLLLAGPVAWVRADSACLAHERIEVEDIGVAIIGFENGARGVIEGSTCTWSRDGHPARIQLSGTGGSAFLADEAFEVWDFKESMPEDERIHASLMKGGGVGLGANNPAAIGFTQHQRNFEEIVSAIREGREPSTSAREARKAVAVIEAIYESARSGGSRIRPSSAV
jgi:predicted dehydrogenase